MNRLAISSQIFQCYFDGSTAQDKFGDFSLNGTVNGSIPIPGGPDGAIAFRFRLRSPHGGVQPNLQGQPINSNRYPPLPLLVERVDPKSGSQLIYNDGYTWVPSNGCRALRVIPSTDEECSNATSGLWALQAEYELEIAQNLLDIQIAGSGPHIRTAYNFLLSNPNNDGTSPQGPMAIFGASAPTSVLQGFRVFPHFVSARIYMPTWPLTVWVYLNDTNTAGWRQGLTYTPSPSGVVVVDFNDIMGGSSGNAIATGETNPWRASRIFLQTAAALTGAEYCELRCEI